MHDEKDPIDERDRRLSLERLARQKALTFDDCASAYIEANRAGWKNDRHASQWENTHFAGNDRGHAIYQAEAQRRAEAEEAARTRVFFADADAL